MFKDRTGQLLAYAQDPGEVYNPVGVPGFSRVDFGAENS
jgi:hypothetical protein